MKKKYKIIIISLLILTVLNLQIVKADDTDINFDYITTIILNGKDKTSESAAKEKNVPMVKPINDYYKKLIEITKNNNKTNCEVFFDSNFHKSEINNYANNYFILIVVIGIIILIIFSGMDFIKAITSKDQDLLKKATNSTKYRIISAVILILLPVISKMIINYIDYLNENKDNTNIAKECEKIDDYVTKDTTIKDKTWGKVLLSPSIKANKIFIGWTANQNGPSIIFNGEVDTSTLIKENLKLYSLFMDTNKETEKFNDITLHNRGSYLNHQNMSKETFIKSTVKNGFNYYVDFDEWYYSKQTGKIYKGLKKINKKTYYFGDDGAVRFGWVTIKKDKYYFNAKGEMVFGTQNIGGVTYNFDEKTGKLIEGASMNYLNAVNIPDSLWQQIIGKNYDPSIIIVDENGQVYAKRKANLKRNGASTTKVFTAYALVKLLDYNNDKVYGSQAAYHFAKGEWNRPIGKNDVWTIEHAAARGFPGSSNTGAEANVIAIGKKYCNCNSDYTAHEIGMKKINELIKSIGCNNSKLYDGSGIHYNTQGSSYGHSANDLALVSIYAMKEKNFVKSYVHNAECNTIGSYPNCKTYAKNKNKDGMFFIKSGSDGQRGHGIWAFNKNRKRYYIAILGAPEEPYSLKVGLANTLHTWAIKEFKL